MFKIQMIHGAYDINFLPGYALVQASFHQFFDHLACAVLQLPSMRKSCRDVSFCKKVGCVLCRILKLLRE